MNNQLNPTSRLLLDLVIIVIHVASRRQPPAPHRWAAARNCQWCRPLRPKTSESTDCREKKREELDSHV